MVEKTKQIRRNAGRFYGFRANCEQVPLLPAWAVRCVWDDPRKIAYLLVWRSRRDHKVKEAVRVARFNSQADPPEPGSVEIKRTDGCVVRIFLAWRSLPHGGNSLLLRCWRCTKACRALYGVKVRDDGHFGTRRAYWECHRCAGLRYSSEGGALLIRGGAVSRLLGRPVPDVTFPRPEPWLPDLFASPMDAVAAGFIEVSEPGKSSPCRTSYARSGHSRSEVSPLFRANREELPDT
jgi:hypothetical protein